MKLFLAALVALSLLVLPVLPAFADAAATPAQVVTVQTSPSSGGLAAPAAGSTTTTVTTAPATVVIPWGDWLDAAIQQVVLPLLATVIAGLVAWASAFLPASLRALVNAKNTAAVEQLLVPAISTGIKKIAADASGKTLDVAVGSAVVAEATQYALDHGPDYLIKWAGGAEGIRQKIIARLPVTTAPIPSPSPLPSVAIRP
jgi:hypothetical protein